MASRGTLFGLMFAAIAILFWRDIEFRRLNIILANIWWAAAYARERK